MEINKENLTPMLLQYVEIKEQHPGYVLFYRLGDFYEMFFDDAVSVSKELGLTLTARAGTPMCGVPHHAAENHIQKLIKRNFRIAMCEQIEIDGKFHREVTRLITPGTLTLDSMLDEGKNNYIAAMFYDKTCARTSIACGDLSTGMLHTGCVDSEQEVINQIARFSPAEILFNTDFMDMKKVGEFLRVKMPCLAEVLPDDDFLAAGDSSPDAKSALIKYIEHTQKTGSACFTSHYKIDNEADEVLEIGMTARHNLELVETMRSREKRGSLLWVIDRTKTAMGKRRIRAIVQQPFKNHLTIIKRLDAVEELSQNTPQLHELRENLSGIYDLERLMSRILYKTANPRDVFALGNACAQIPSVKSILAEFSSPLIKQINSSIDSLDEISALIENAILDNPPAITREGGYINDGFNKELDRLRELTNGGQELLHKIESRERESTGIKSLKVGYNRVFGYYIEISKANMSSAPPHYIRKQTLTNGERYITEELKKIEDDILSAKTKIIELELEIFGDVKGFIGQSLEKIQSTAGSIAEIDVLCSLADVAVRENYCRPELSLDKIIDIRDSRHPVVEKVLSDTAFTPNDCFLDGKNSRTAIITGPNMAGKSTYMRQIALIMIMAQMGSFVPAKSARIGTADKIYTRVGASDDLSAGQSTFMVEMLEVAEILAGATGDSFVILDEIGRGTSTFDGVSIAKSVAEYINDKIKCKTLFATHYHELIKLEKQHLGVINLSVSVAKRGEELTFLHKIIGGGTDKSYGIEVAKLAGLPDKVISGARKALKSMELNSKIELEEQLQNEEESGGQIDFSLIARDNAITRLKSLDLNTITPMDALTELSEIKKLL
jgi:DNA mismatch repair protein MutS